MSDNGTTTKLTPQERMKALWEKRRAEGWVNPNKGKKHDAKKEVWSPENAVPIQASTWMDSIHRKLDALLDVLTNHFAGTKVLSAQSAMVNQPDPATPALMPLREKLSKLREEKYKGVTITAEQAFKRLGVKTKENAVMENRAFWDSFNLQLVDEVLVQEGFEKDESGKYKVGPK